MAHANRSWGEALFNLNIVTASAMMVFAVLGLIMVGIAGDVVSLMETYKFLPLAAAFACYSVIFASSGTRNPEHYHPAEWFVVVLTALLMVAHTVLIEVQNIVMGSLPVTVLVLLLMNLTAAILAR